MENTKETRQFYTMEAALVAISDDDRRLIGELAEKACIALGPSYERLPLEMDLVAAHHACPLKLADMVAHAERGAMYYGSVLHDIGGICRHLNRETGELMDCFVPRFAKPKGEAP